MWNCNKFITHNIIDFIYFEIIHKTKSAFLLHLKTLHLKDVAEGGILIDFIE